MLTIIKLLPPPKGFRIKRRIRRGRVPPRQRLRSVMGLDYRIVELYAARSNIISSQLAGLIDKSDLVIPCPLPDDVIIPRCEICDLRDFKARLSVNFAKETLRICQKSNRIRLLLIDRDGLCVGAAAELIPYCDVSVCTLFPERYDRCVQYTRINFGAEPLISSDCRFEGAGLALAPFGLSGFTVPNSSTPLISPDAKDHGLIIPDDQLVPVPDIAESSPDGVDPALFSAGVFYEGEFDLFFKVCPKKLQSDTLFLTPADLSRVISGR